MTQPIAERTLLKIDGLRVFTTLGLFFVYEGIYLIVWAHSERVAYACARITHARVGGVIL